MLVSVPVALAVGTSWRLAWIVFAAPAALATVWAAAALGGARAAPAPVERLRPSWFVCPRSGPLLAAAPGSWLAVVPSAVLFGMVYNVLLAVEAIWSARVFAGRPATGLAAVMFMLAVGLLLGPAAAGAVAASQGLPAAFLAGAVVVAATALLTPAEDLAASRA